MTTAILASLEQQAKENEYIDISGKVQDGGTTATRLHEKSIKIPIRKGVQSHDFSHLDWNERCHEIHGSKLSNLRFTDNVTVIVENLRELELAFNELSSVSEQKGLKINMSNTQVPLDKRVDQRQVIVKGSEIE